MDSDGVWRLAMKVANAGKRRRTQKPSETSEEDSPPRAEQTRVHSAI